MIIESVPKCRFYDCPIDDRLVNWERPGCIDAQNGCANCPECYQATVVDGVEVRETAP